MGCVILSAVKVLPEARDFWVGTRRTTFHSTPKTKRLHQSSDSATLSWGLRFCIFDKMRLMLLVYGIYF